jgi:hypothetical protein
MRLKQCSKSIKDDHSLEIWESFFCSLQESDRLTEQRTAFRQLESILSFHRFTRIGRYSDALRELSKLAFLPLDNRTPEMSAEALRQTSLSVQVQFLCVQLYFLQLQFANKEK